MACRIVHIAMAQEELHGYDGQSGILVSYIWAMELRSFSKFLLHRARDAICDNSNLWNCFVENGGDEAALILKSVRRALMFVIQRMRTQRYSGSRLLLTLSKCQEFCQVVVNYAQRHLSLCSCFLSLVSCVGHGVLSSKCCYVVAISVLLVIVDFEIDSCRESSLIHQEL